MHPSQQTDACSTLYYESQHTTITTADVSSSGPVSGKGILKQVTFFQPYLLLPLF